MQSMFICFIMSLSSFFVTLTHIIMFDCCDLMFSLNLRTSFELFLLDIIPIGRQLSSKKGHQGFATQKCIFHKSGPPHQMIKKGQYAMCLVCDILKEMVALPLYIIYIIIILILL